MVLLASSAPVTPLRSPHSRTAHAALTLALVTVACNAYDPSLLDGRRRPGAGAEGSPIDGEQEGGSVASSGMPPANGTGGAPSSSSGGARSGNGGAGGARDSGASGGSSGAPVGTGGRDDTGSQGGSDPTGTGGAKGLGGTVSTGGASSAGGDATSSGGTANGGAETGGSGKGGSTSGGAGSAGTSGAAGKSGSGGAASGGTPGTGGTGELCSGCARLSVPLTMTTDRARFALTLPSKTDFTDTTITLRVARQKGTGGTVLAYLQAGSPNYALLFSAAIKIDSLSSSMQNIVWNIADTAGNADPTAIERIGIEIVGTGGSPFTNPTVIYVDRVDVARSSLTMGSWSFDTATSVYTTPTSSGPTGQLWLNSYSADTNVSGATLSWLGP